MSHAQSELTQTLRGRVVDAVTNVPIPSAGVILSNMSISVLSDTFGRFRFEKIGIGRYNIVVHSVGYEILSLTDIDVQTGKETIIDLKLSPSNTLLDRFEVRSATTEIAKIGLAQSLNMETLQRLPANFNDVARMLTTVAGVSAENDGANHISIRGLSPNAMQWFLEGAEIVNPNHLSNAGVNGDRASLNGGGVSIFSTQVLERADFYKGSTPTGFGNALGGAIDARFRKGNDAHQETSVGIGLIGLEASTEGVFSKKSKASYLVNYRYSTLGLLSKLGVALGDESFAFQDISFKMNFPTQKMGEFTVFGVGGTSENLFEHKKRSEWLTQKDSQDITFKNRMGAVGVSHNMTLNRKTNWQTVAVLSALESSRLAVGLTALELTENVYNFNTIYRKLFVKSQVNHQFRKGALSVGLVVKNEFIDKQDDYKTRFQTWQDVSYGQGMWYMPFGEFQGKIGSKWGYSLGIRANYFSFTERLSVEPTAMLQRKMGQNGSVKLTYSRQSQLLTPDIYFRKSSGIYYNNKFDFIKSDNMNLTYSHNFVQGSHNILLNISAFGQFYHNIFVHDPQFPPQDYWSVLDNFSSNIESFGGMYGTAQSIGFEATIQQNNHNGWFWQANVTLFDATFKEPFRTRTMAYNSQYIVNGYIGKEWLIGRRQNRFLGVGSRTILRGGNWQRIGFSSNETQVAPYFRTDLNVYVKRNRKNWSSTLQLDIQNATNRENEQYYYFDRFTQKQTPQYQLGLIPNLSYRIAF